MRALQRPSADARALFLACAGRIASVELRGRLASVADRVAAESALFAQLAASGATHMAVPSTTVGGVVTKDEMIRLYDSHVARKGAVGRPVYDEIFNSPPYSTCPLCAQRVVSSLDHFMAKAVFPALAVTPDNLVPACFDCNKAKQDAAEAVLSPGTQLLHPYFDRLPTNEQWLWARVVDQPTVALQFFVEPPVTWDGIFRNRVANHFHVLGLKRLYASNAAQELSNIRHSLRMVLGVSGASGVQAHLLEQWRSRNTAQVNSWQTAMYAAMYHDQWFCQGGFDSVT